MLGKTAETIIKEAFPDKHDLFVTIAFMQGMTKAAEEAGLDKEAFWGALANLGAKAIPWLGRLGKSVISGGSKVWNAAAKPIEQGFGWAGKGVLSGAEKVLPQAASQRILPYARIAGQGMAKDMASWGLFSGGINAALAPEGERGKAFLTGFIPGAAGGAAWRGASNLLGKGLRYTMGRYNTLGGAPAARNLLNLASKNKSMFEKGINTTERLKRLGAKTVTKALPLTGAIGTSLLIPGGENGAPMPQAGPGAGQYNPYGQAAGASDGSW